MSEENTGEPPRDDQTAASQAKDVAAEAKRIVGDALSGWPQEGKQDRHPDDTATIEGSHLAKTDAVGQPSSPPADKLNKSTPQPDK